MRVANAQLQHDRRDEILSAAQRLFARTGFHQTSMQQICAAAGMSPGNLYRYFPSKEAIIAGIAERDRAEVASQLDGVENAPDFFGTLEALAHHHFVERTADEVGLCAEIMTESRRNPAIARIMGDFDKDVFVRLKKMLQTAAERGEISRDIDFDSVVSMMMVIADGVWWRRAVEPDFDAKSMLPLFMAITRFMLMGGGRDAAKKSGEK
jgi:TetR/AcrR family transcriptional regulator, repressor for uid operon